jgi:hypothetical protein
MMLSASVIGGNKRTLDRLKRQRGSGSLPLKKRRVNLYQTPLAEDEPSGTFVPLKLEARKISCEDLKLVTPEPSSATATAAASVGCVSMITSGFCNKPCFKQSSYCKQHFLQQQQQQQLQQQQQQGTLSGSGSGDKRYTGADGQIRCCATTTRGRPCAYVAVGGLGPLKYCHLHADYDTNPSPRRDAAKRDSTSSSSTSSSSSSPPPSSASPSSPPSTISPQATPTSSDIPLLSSVPTDKWKHQSVRIGLGPLTGRIGVVEKWGNGWVSCSVEGVGLHNRRAFELQLLMGSTGTTRTNKKQPKSPSPPPMTPTTTKSPAAIKQVTPCSVADVSSIQVPEIRLPHDDDSKTLSFRLSERSSVAFHNPV